MDYLDQIVAHKRANGRPPEPDLEEQAQKAAPPRPFTQHLGTYQSVVIAECKKASPSRGVLVENYDPVALAKLYEANGASAISVLTDENFFQGSMDDLMKVREVVDVPVLRKDFALGEQDVLEARAAGADIVLLIARILTPEELDRLISVTKDLGMDALVEVHDDGDVDKALNASAELLGINNRDLGSFKTDLAVTERLLESIPSRIPVMSESGIHTGQDVARLRELGARGVLVGEALIKAIDTAALLQEMVEACCPDCWRERVAAQRDAAHESQERVPEEAHT